MVKNGYACDYVKYSKKKYAKEQQYAKTKKLGIWNMKLNHRVFEIVKKFKKANSPRIPPGFARNVLLMTKSPFS